MLNEDVKKITAHIPATLLRKAQKATNLNITETLKLGLEELARKKAYQDMLALRGSYKFALTLDEMREDRDTL